jgi:hypothetical protein
MDRDHDPHHHHRGGHSCRHRHRRSGVSGARAVAFRRRRHPLRSQFSCELAREILASTSSNRRRRTVRRPQNANVFSSTPVRSVLTRSVGSLPVGGPGPPAALFAYADASAARRSGTTSGGAPSIQHIGGCWGRLSRGSTTPRKRNMFAWWRWFSHRAPEIPPIEFRPEKPMPRFTQEGK